MSAYRRKIAYDRIVTRFSPEGRLFQVEYAFETVKRGATIVGLVCNEGVVLGTQEPMRDELQDVRLSEKIYELDQHVGAVVAGLTSDARVLVDRARMYAQSNRLAYDEPVDIEVLTKRIGDVKQQFTQQIAVRPFGVSLIIGGVDKAGSRLFKTHPSGSYQSFNAVAEGIGRETVETMLEEEFKCNMTLSETIELAVKCLLEDLKARGREARLRVATVPVETARFAVLSEKQFKEHKKVMEKTDQG